jgi:ATP-dependent DNA helicase RecG
MPQRWLRGLIWRTLETSEQQITEPFAVLFPKTLPTRSNAVHMLHFPEELTDAEIARQRLALDEFLGLQIQILSRRKKFEANSQALPCKGDNRLIKPFLAKLGFKLTSAQTRVLREIRTDMSSAHPMRRLLQGDVGSGKTAVAACTALMALESGFNVALMAPTEILAEQHSETLPAGLNRSESTCKCKRAAAKPAEMAYASLLPTPNSHLLFSSAPTPCSPPASTCPISAW